MHTTQTVSLKDMLDARERRAARQAALVQAYALPLISFCMNIAGPVKSNPLIRRGFHEGLRILKNQLRASRLQIRHEEKRLSFTGDEALLVVAGDPAQIKKICCEIEDFDDLGRLFDMDVITPDLQKVARENTAQPPRRCLLCDSAAKDCARSRSHSAEELWQRTQDILLKAMQAIDARHIATQAVRALLCEVCVSPKPGLVDRYNNGSHHDMDIFLYMHSSAALYDYFRRCAELGQQACSAPECFRRLQILGRRAEADMFAATRGINTHKGAIFSLGVLCAASARIGKEGWQDTAGLLQECRAMLTGLCDRAFSHLKMSAALTVGEELYLRHGIKGARGQAEAGFPTVLQVGLPILKQGLQQGLSFNDAAAAALLHIIAHEADSNMIHRGGYETQQKEAQRLQEMLAEAPFPDRVCIDALDADYIARNLSPGGSADLLALCCYLYFLEEGEA